MCLVIALGTNGITKSKASNTQADDGYKKIRRKHTQVPPFARFLQADFYVTRGHSPLE